MSNLRQARRRLIITMIVFGLLDVVAVAVLVLSLVAPSDARPQRVNALQAEVQGKIRTWIPPDQVQSRINDARKQIDEFYRTRLPSESSAISGELGRLAAQNQVTLTQAKYDVGDPPIPGVRVVTIDASLVGNYVQEVRFINALERSRLMFLVNSVTLGEQTGGKVRLQLKLET